MLQAQVGAGVKCDSDQLHVATKINDQSPPPASHSSLRHLFILGISLLLEKNTNGIN
jgi:hypothetical protein